MMAIDMERLLDSVKSVESGGNRFAVSPKGAMGPYQFMPDTAREFGVKDPFDERQARDGARRKMSGLLKQYNGDLNQALAAWNFGQGNLANTGMGRLPPETQGFVRKVNGLYGAVTPPQPLAPARPTQQFSLAPGEMAIRQRIADGLLSNDRSSDALKTSVLNPLPTDKAKRIYDMQLKTGLPVGVIERNLDEIERKSREKGFDAEKFRRESPLLAKWLAKSPAHSALAQYDFTSLQNLENAWNLFASGGSQGFKQSLKGELTYKAILGTITPQEEQERQRLKVEIEKLGKPYEEGFPSWLFQAANVVGMQIPLAAEASKKGAEYGIPLGAAAGGTLGLIGGPGAPVSVAAGAAIGGGIGYGKFAYGSYIEQTYHQAVAESFDDLEEAKDANGKRIDPVVARYAALLVGMPNALLEFASLRQAVKLIPGADKVLGSLTTEGAKQILARPSVTAALADISKKYAVAVGTETFTEGMQKVATIFARELAMGGAGTGITKEDVQATGKEMAMAFKGAAVLGGLASGPKIVETYVDIQRAARNEAFMRNLGETVQQSKMSASSPEAMGSFVAELKKDGPIKNVYVSVEDWNTVFQSAAPQAAQEVFGSADQYNEATTVGGDIVIPIDLYAEKVAATPFHEKLVPYVKLDVYDMTPTQAQEVIENEKDLIELANLDAEQTIEQQKPLTAVYNDVYAKLRSIGQTPQRANREALLTRHRIQARAERLGIDPLVLYNEQPMTVTRVLPEKLKAYNQQLAEPAVPFAPKLPLPEGELGLEPATEQEAKAAAEAVSAGQASFDEFGVYGATIHPVKGNLSGTPGVAVAGYPQRGVVTEGAPTKEEAEAFMVRNRDIFQADPNAALGIWVDNDTGKGYLDITNALPREEAVAQGEYLGELAVWDLEHFEEIRLPVQRDTGQQVLFQPVFHGSPYKFDKFSLEHLGKGEGAQAYGWGLYFAGKRDVAEYYRENVTKQRRLLEQDIIIEGVKLDDYLHNAKIHRYSRSKIINAIRQSDTLDGTIDWLNDEEQLTKDTGAYTEDDKIIYDEARSILTEIQSKKVQFLEPDKGQLYKAEIPDDDVILAWDASIENQPEGVQDILEEAGLWSNDPSDTGETLYIGLKFELGSDKAASERLNDLGIKGLKYLDAVSRTEGDTHNYVIFDDSAINILETYYQDKRGASVPTKNLIALFEKADPSTFLHESGHIWLEELRLDAQRPDAPAQLKADWEIAKQWIGATDEKISTKAHEKFARGVEKYVMEGHVPSVELRDILTQFKDWLFRIYKNMSALDVELTPEVVGVMDRLLATDEAIAQAREQTMADAAILTGEGMTNAEYQAYLESIKDARFRAENEFRIQVMKELRRERLQEWREKRAAMAKQVEQDVLELPIYRVAYWLWHGKLPDGTVVEGLEAHQLDMQAVLDLGVNPTKLGVRVQKNGIHPDVLARHFGYPSGEALVRELVGLKPLKKMVDDVTGARMKEEHGDLMADGTFSAKAMLTAHGPKTADVLAYELKILKRIGANRSMADPAALKHIAHQIIQRKRIGDLHPAIYAAAARRAAEEALIAKRDNNLDQTFDSKQRQLLNLYLLKEATERRLEIDKSVKKWKTFLFRSDKRLAKSYNMDLVNAARSIAAIHGIGGAEKMPADYLTQLQEYDPQTYANIKDLVALAAADGRPIDDMPVSDFETVKDAIEGLWFLARRTRQMEVDGKLVDRDQVIGELSTTLATLIPAGTKRRGYHKAVTKWEQAKIGLNSAKALLTRTEFWVDLMDSGDPLGAFRRNIWNPVSEAADEFRVKRIEYLNKYAAIVNRMSPDMFTAGQIDATEYFDYVFSSKMELLGAMLHTGNESNFQKLLYGREWAGIADGELDSTNWDKFIKKMQDTGVLTKNDYDFLQAVWNLLEEMKPAAQKTHRQLFGYYFDEITARPFVTPFGTYKGGYFPATVDPFAVEDVAIRQELEAVEQRPSSFIFPSTGKGFTQLRNERYRRPLSLDLGLTQQHIEKVLRFTYLEPHIQDVGRVVTNRDFRANLALLDAEVGSVMLVPWLQRTALQQTELPSGPKMRQVSAALHWMRTGAGMQVLAANFTNFLQQFTGFSLGAIKVKPRYMAGALFRYLSSPKDYARMIAEASPMMSTRLTSAIMDIKRNIDDITMNPNVYQKARAFSNQHAYFLSTASQHVVDLVVWGGAYDQAITDGADETLARRQADSAVRQTQGSFNPEDISRAEAGTAFHKMFTMFYGYFNMAANLNATEFAKAMRQQGYNATGRLLYVYTFAYMIPAVLSELIVQAMSGELFDDDDDDGYLDNLLSVFFGGQVRFGTAMIPFLGQGIQVAINAHNDKWYDDRINLSPAVSAIEAGGRVIFGRDAYLLAADEDVRMKRPVQDLLTTIGMVTNLPVGPLGRPVGYMLDVEQGYTEPESAVEMTRGLITGKTPQ